METASNRRKVGHLLYRYYRDADDDQCKALEMRAMQGVRFPALQKVVSLLVKGGFEHFETFDAKAKQYEDHVIRVVEDEANGNRLVGVCCAALKKAIVHSEKCIIGYIFDLRVDEDYQGYGIGLELSSQIEAECAHRGAKFLYLSVNSTNTKALSLYKKTGYEHASYRSPALQLLLYEEEEPSDITVETLAVDEALQLTVEAYKNSDLTPVAMNELFTSSCYEGTLLARRGDSYAGASSWNGSSLTGWKIDRLILPMAWWRSLGAKIAFGSVALYAVLAWARVVCASLQEASVDREAYKIVKFGGFVSVTVCGSLGLLYAWPALSFMAGKLANAAGDRKLKHRSFAPFGRGPMAEQEALLRAVLKRMHNRAREAGYAISLCNLDKAHPLRGCYASSKFSTIFLYKRIGSSSEPLPPLTADNFFDPRDL